MKEIQEILVRVSAGFELARVRVIGSQLYVYKELNQNNSANGTENVFVQVPKSKSLQ